jgi:GNAT superfamily N-acetyltransferase
MRTAQVLVRECVSEADELVSLEIHNAVWPQQAVTMDEVRSFKSRTLDSADFLALLDGAAVGSAVIAILPQRRDLGFVLSTVLAKRRRSGAGAALYEAVSRWASDRSLAVLWAPVMEDDSEGLSFAEQRGFVEVERTPRMVLDLGAIKEGQHVAPAGVEIASWAGRPELNRGLYDVAAEAYADVPGAEEDEMETFEDWLAHDMNGAGSLPEATFVAIAGDEVVGYAKLSQTAARPAVAKHDMTAVKRGWRGHGIARALKQAQISWAIGSGLQQLETSNEIRNAPIRGLNTELGYRSAPGRVLLQGPPAACQHLEAG